MARSFSETRQIIKELPNAKRERAEKLLDKIEFMDGQLEELQKILKSKGWTEEYFNGATQHGLKKSSEADVYIALNKNYVTALKQIEAMLEGAGESEGGDELLEFLKKGKGAI